MSARTAGLGDDTLHVLDLSLAAGEGAELREVSFVRFIREWLVTGRALLVVGVCVFHKSIVNPANVNQGIHHTQQQRTSLAIHPTQTDIPSS